MRRWIPMICTGFVCLLSVSASAQELDVAGEWILTQTPEIILRFRSSEGRSLGGVWVPVEGISAQLRQIPWVRMEERVVGRLFGLEAFTPYTDPTQEIARALSFSRRLTLDLERDTRVLHLDVGDISELPIHLVTEKQRDGSVHWVGGTSEIETSWRDFPEGGPSGRYRVERHVAIRFAEEDRFTVRFRTRWHPELDRSAPEASRRFRDLIREILREYGLIFDQEAPEMSLPRVELVFQFVGERAPSAPAP
jgi:hypothetical protein